MASVPATPSVIQDIMETNEEREFWTTVRLHERPPYFSTDEGVGNRLNRAARVVTDGRLTPNSDGSYSVEGREGHTYRVREHCSCPDSKGRKERGPCYHEIAVVLYVEWQRRLRPLAPAWQDPGARAVDDKTLPLPLPPTSVDERLATPAAQEPLGAFMSEDESAYIPEPAVVSTAVVEPPVATRALTPVVPQVDDLEAALQTWTTERAVVQRFLKQELRPNIDYYTLKIGGKESKPSLSKAGAEKVLGWLKLQAAFTPDIGTWEMLGRPQDLVCYVCTLRTRSGEVVGEGRGARSLKKDGGDVNKAIKMAEKSACVSAVLRTGALSDVFTCDLEDMQDAATVQAPARPWMESQGRPNSSELRQRIWALVKAADGTITSREACESYVQRATGLALDPDNYAKVVEALERRA